MATKLLPPEELGESQAPVSTASPDFSQVQRELNSLAHEIGVFDAESASRLEDIGEQIADQPYRLAALDPYQAVSPAAIEQRAALYHQRQRGASLINVLEILRNALVLFPIFLTWVGLSFASNSYAQELLAHPEKSGMPFLLLWEEGFDGGVINNLLRFSHIAAFDFALIFVIILLTIVFHYYSEIQVARARKQATDLRQRLEQVFWKLGNLLADTRAKTPDALVSKLAQMVNRLEAQQYLLQKVNQSIASDSDLLKQMYDSFADERTKFLTVANELAAKQGSVVQKAADNITQLNTATAQIKTSLENVSGNLDQAVDAAVTAANAVKGVESNMNAVVGKLGTVSADIGNVSAGLQQTSQDMKSTVQEAGNINQAVRQTVNQVSQLTQRVDGVQASLQAISADLKANASAVGSAAAGVNNAGQKMEQVTLRLESVTNGMTANAATFSQISRDLQANVAQADASNKQLQGFVQNFGTMAQQVLGGLNTAAQNVLTAFHNETNQIKQSMTGLGTTFAQPIQGIFQSNNQAFADINSRILQLHQNVASADQTIQQQLNYLNSVMAMQRKTGGGNFSGRFVQWFTVFLLSAVLVTLLALGVWFFTGGNILIVVVVLLISSVIVVSLAAVFAWLGQ